MLDSYIFFVIIIIGLLSQTDHYWYKDFSFFLINFTITIIIYLQKYLNYHHYFNHFMNNYFIPLLLHPLHYIHFHYYMFKLIFPFYA